MEEIGRIGLELERATALTGAGIPWAIAAGTGVYLYTGNRPPTDLDIMVHLGNLPRAAGLLGMSIERETLSWGVSSRAVAGRTELVGGLEITIDEKRFYYAMDDEMASHICLRLFEGGTEAPVLSPEDLIALKLTLQRGPEQGKHDLEDVAALAETLSIDRSYLRWRLRQMGALERAGTLLASYGW